MNTAPEQQQPQPRAVFLVFLFSATLFLSALLMFAVQPMVGKMLLPMVGGAPSGWLVAMAFFQLALLVGYFLADKLAALPVRWHGAALIVLLLGGWLVQPISFPSALPGLEEIPESFRVFLTLAARMAVPFIALAMLSPSLQRLFAASGSRSAKDPYFLFAASNLGSFVGLLLYLVWLERYKGLSAQSLWWQEGFLALLGLCLLCWGFVVWRAPREQRPAGKTKAAQQTDWRERLRWLALAFVPSSLLLGVTAHITVDVGAVPLLWVFPLALYLLTFVVAFARKKKTEPAWLTYAHPVFAVTFVSSAMFQPGGVAAMRFDHLVLPFAVFVLTALRAHYALAAARPETGRLTEFYLYLAAGGALGGLFNAFVAPFIFPVPFEFFVVAAGSLLVFPPVGAWPFPRVRYAYPIAAFVAVLTTAILPIVRELDFGFATFFIASLSFLALVVLVYRPRVFTPIVLGLGLYVYFVFINVNVLETNRNFFGVIRVYERTEKNGEVYRVLSHGTTVHGVQKVRPQPDYTPTVYYHPAGPLGDLMTHLSPRHVGVIGMGTGATVCHKAPGRLFTFYDIDAAVPPLAAKWFDFMRVCGDPRIVIGDGRKGLAETKDSQYDLLIVDAFTSDAVPVHLMTKEALEEYISHLKKGGVVTFHISNRFYDLRLPLSSLAEALGLKALYKHFEADNQGPGISTSLWVALAPRDVMLGGLREKGWTDLPLPSTPVWTDDYSNLITVLKRN